jgi:hypothetical protein
VARYRFSSLPPIKAFSADGTPISDPPDYVAKARREIMRWERAKRGAIGKLGDAALSPAAMLTERVVPSWLRESSAFVIEKTLRLAAYASALSVDEKAAVRAHGRLVLERHSVGEELNVCEKRAKKHWSDHCKYGAAQGAAMGLAGVTGFLADVPLIISVVIREIRMIGLSFGYRVTTPMEVDYVLHILRMASSVDDDARAESLAALKKIEARARLEKQHRKRRGAKDLPKVRYLVSLEQYSRSLAMQMIRRGLLHFVPLAGVITGASFNAAYAHDVGRAAFMCYRRRFLEDLTSE